MSIATCHLQHQRVLYSAPFALVGKTLWIRVTDSALTIYRDFEHVYTHRLGKRPGERITVPDHLPPHAAAFLAHDRVWACLEQGAEDRSCLERLVATCLLTGILERLRDAQGVLRLTSQFTPVRLEAACNRALAHGSPFYRTVKTILVGGHDLQADPNAFGIDTPSRVWAERALCARRPEPLYRAARSAALIRGNTHEPQS